MKRGNSKILIAIILLLLCPMLIQSQDTNTIKFFPLKVGNIWVYHCTAFGSMCGCSMQTRIKTISSITLNAKTYFVFQITNRIISQTCSGCGCGMISFDTLRVDSMNCNIYKYSYQGCSYSPHEIMFDSLKAHLNDTIKTSCGSIPNYKCIDTSSQNILGVLRQTRSFAVINVDSYSGRTFTKGIGMSSYGCGGQTCVQSTTILGCVINGIVYGDTSFPLGVTQIGTEIPVSYSLSQNYPNPFNPVTKIKFSLPSPSQGGVMTVKFVVYDVLGREIATLVNEQLQPGTYEVEWNASNYSSGIYFCKLITSDPLTGSGQSYTETRKMVLIK
jgi:hypothetical protein